MKLEISAIYVNSFHLWMEELSIETWQVYHFLCLLDPRIKLP